MVRRDVLRKIKRKITILRRAKCARVYEKIEKSPWAVNRSNTHRVYCDYRRLDCSETVRRPVKLTRFRNVGQTRDFSGTNERTL